ncbi:sigma 54-interacting transcriptional regulator [Colwellia sp. E2M01]|uniref:sigma 54-interacting transcriptional regulator n=1 Tax=Colwellia sp. E2M01 TaxID=2841561 RepID=UPI001C0A5CCD|nr:sigma 54-interacting transcriptional regulator [Colwellia sp. E2M01]MBU2870583.1 sigma 54-interacting transcriptional regulator [Colwellia sp. E2M01]
MKSSLFLNAPQALLFIDPFNNQILEFNNKAASLFALEHKDTGNNVTDLSATHFFKGCIEELIHVTQQVLAKGKAWSNDLFITVNGDKVYLDITANAVDNKILFSCQNANLTFARYHQAIAQAEYQAGIVHWNANETVFEGIERQNQLLLSAVGDGIYGVDVNGNTTFVNKAAEQILGWNKSDLVAKNIHEVIHHSHENGEHYHDIECPIYAAFKDGEIHSVDDEVFWKKNGEPVAVEYKSTPVTENGLLIGAVVIFRDITERKNIQEKLLNAIKEIDTLKHRLEMDNAYLLEELNADFNHHQIIGQSIKVQHMVKQIELVGATNANVLIAGESGTGKELIARAIHEVSERKARPLIRVNCAAIPAELFESEFFGHVKGAFSGAISDRIGRFELADGATIFLDEVGEIPLQLQGKLLRVLQEQQFERVGESKTRHVDVRVISATNQNLQTLVRQNKFREDLYFRLNVFPIHSPALRERTEDIPLLVKHFIDKVCISLNRPQPDVSVAQMQFLTQYHWPGNIRELENIIERQIILATSNKVSFTFLAKESLSNKSLANKTFTDDLFSEAPIQHQPMDSIDHLSASVSPPLISAKAQKLLEKNNVENVLRRCNGKIYGKDGAAQLLGLKPTTLASRLKKYGLNKNDYVN